MSPLIWAGSILGLLTYFPLWKQIRSGDADQNLFTWALWAALDGIVAAAIMSKGGSFLLPAIYAVGSSGTTFFILRSGKKSSWTMIETLVIFLVLASMTIWYLYGGKVATIAGTIAMVIASIPQLVDAWKKPKEMPILVFTSYLVANSLVTAGGKSWSIEERFYPVSAVLVCFLFVVFSVRRFWLKSMPTQSS